MQTDSWRFCNTYRIFWIRVIAFGLKCNKNLVSRLSAGEAQGGGQSIMPAALSNLQDNLSAKGISIWYTASQKGVYLLYNFLIIFYISNMLAEKKKQKQEVSMRTNEANKHID